jgi:hypothetical protein
MDTLPMILALSRTIQEKSGADVVMFHYRKFSQKHEQLLVELHKMVKGQLAQVMIPVSALQMNDSAIERHFVEYICERFRHDIERKEKELSNVATNEG